MRIWFNRGFSLPAIANAVIPRLHPSAGIELFIGQPAGQPHKETLATIIDEPDLPRAEYGAWAAQTARDLGIDLIVASTRRHALAEAQNLLPCPLVLPTSAFVVGLLDDKLAFAEAMADTPWHIPTTSYANVESFETAYDAFREQNPGLDACIKPRRGVNGHGFWHLDPAASEAAHMIDPDRRCITPAMYAVNIAAQNSIDEQVLMPFLPGLECSVDILAWHGKGLRAAARTKLARDRQCVETNHPLVPVALDLATRFNLHGVVNAQFRADAAGNWKLLEINSRPAGGSVIAEYAGGQILTDWLRLLAGHQDVDDVLRHPVELAHDLVSGTRFDKQPIPIIH